MAGGVQMRGFKQTIEVLLWSERERRRNKKPRVALASSRYVQRPNSVAAGAQCSTLWKVEERHLLLRNFLHEVVYFSGQPFHTLVLRLGIKNDT